MPTSHTYLQKEWIFHGQESPKGDRYLFADGHRSPRRERYRAAKNSGFAKWITPAIADWDKHKIDQSQRRQVEQWFKTTESYIFELMEVNSLPTKKKINSDIVTFISKRRLRTVLEYGCGVAELAILASKVGVSISIADVPGHTLRFAKWRIKKRKLDIKTIPIRTDTPLTSRYECIVCLEVLQHVFRPHRVAQHLIDHLEDDGYLIISTRFHNPHYHMALRKNSTIEEGMVTFFTTQGLKLIDRQYQYGEGESAKYVYYFQQKKS